MSPDVNRRSFLKTTAAMSALSGAGLTGLNTVFAKNPTKQKTDDIVNYNEQMEYRRAGKTNLMISCVCLGGHWKRVNTVVPGLFKGNSWLAADTKNKEFEKNRWDVVSQCIDRGINFIDACTSQEVIMYAKALKGRRDKMILGYSWYQAEMRKLSREWKAAKKAGKPKPPGWITAELKKTLDHGLKETGLEYVDVWRIVLNSISSGHEPQEMEETVEALAWSKKTGKARFTGISSHDRPHIKKIIEEFPEEMQIVCTPYTAKTKLAGAKVVASNEEGGVGDRVVPVKDSDWENSLWAAFVKHDVGWFGIKPFASGSMFKGDSSPGNPHEAEDNKLARLTIRAILTNPTITAPIPGIITPAQIDNLALAVLQRKKLDEKEQALLDEETNRAFANLPHQYKWLNDWNIV